jgi:hypothetical protein
MDTRLIFRDYNRSIKTDGGTHHRGLSTRRVVGRLSEFQSGKSAGLSARKIL